MNTTAVAQIEEAIKNIPKTEILAVAKEIKDKIKSDSSLVEIKDKKEFVSKADFDIQKALLKYFANSALADTYKIKAEEELSVAEKEQNQGVKEWQLIIDPLDGTSAFCKGQETWGVMVGLCDKSGKLIYSWNLISTGEIYSSFEERNLPENVSWEKSFETNGQISVDVYDYGAGAAEKFGMLCEIESSDKFQAGQFAVTSYPAAIWAGAELFKGRSNGLLWVPSSEGKKNYPDYDLVFLGALAKQGWKIILGKIGEAVEMVVIAPNTETVNLLWQVGLKMIPGEKTQMLRREEELKITSAI